MTVENASDKKLENLSISVVDEQFNFTFGVASPGIKKSYHPHGSMEVPQEVELSWTEENVDKRVSVRVPEEIRKKIRGRNEDLIFFICDNAEVKVFLEITNPRDLANPTYSPEKPKCDK